ncbi:UDP-2,4-diacetamido-2,4,6-trideoxy-beta-L-altropyranose hydrolase [Janthinobacterium sp. BJB401]|uniref:UDP-2,4-diacetamido-2,4, 6-trideoxy-beta-L-altropyranose hydrolase n=1 Tax=Janthinobacterium sp. BJB401 TaxID=2745934 RepID=UPI0015952152|nr:UDP-2,4-diacetamido-2,4,6-trideoxy-beta-L-altropyranose hydrolase [Janthinobacterium sp. BJB401]NVI80402.1 UDP-2,4-diacetamido-2,4,6-trideoxy-beta-L-altropyranose hydrolase [Janthinobacterium sp. BJB401]
MSSSVVIRVDASLQMGSGHVMRCATLAEELRLRGAAVTFVCRELTGNYIDWLRTQQFEVLSLTAPICAVAEGAASSPAHLAWLGVPLEQELDEVRALLSPRQAADWIIVDHYALDARWEQAAKAFAARIMVIDDLADRAHDCSVLLDQNYYHDMQQRYDGLLPSVCLRLLGPRHALLRSEFSSWRARCGLRSAAVHRVLVFFGGVDADNYTAPAIAALARANRPELQVDVVIGMRHPARAAIEDACAKHGFTCHVQTSRMAELMAAADLAIGAGGTATWERCSLGLPTLTLCVADNQRQLVDDAALGGLVYAPDMRPGVELEDTLLLHYTALLDNPALRQCLSRQSHAIVDGRGTARVARKLGMGAIVLRKASEDDSADLMLWRNHESIRAVSRSSAPIALESHQHWLTALLTDPQRILMIGQQRNGQPVGVVRFDLLQDSAEVSIYLVPGTQQQGLGAELLASAEQWLRNMRADITTIRAEVLGDNQPSHRLFLTAGYVRNSTSYFKKVLQHD